jgi:hypothetical protein
VVRDVRGKLPDVVESGWSGRRLADNSRLLIASAFMVLGVGLVIATKSRSLWLITCPAGTLSC